MTLFSTMQTEPATLQLQACKYLPNKADLLQIMNLGEASTGSLSDKWNSLHKMKTRQTDCTISLGPLKMSHALCPPGLSVCCAVLRCYICVWWYSSTTIPMEHENSMLGTCKGFRGFCLRDRHTQDMLWQRSVVVWLPSCHRTEDDGLPCQIPLNITSKPPRSSPAAGGRCYSWINRKRQTTCPSSQKWWKSQAESSCFDSS